MSQTSENKSNSPFKIQTGISKVSNTTVVKSILYSLFEDEILEKNVETQRIKNRLTALRAEELSTILRVATAKAEWNILDAKGKLDNAKVALLERAIENVGKLSSTSLRYVLLAFINPTSMTNEQDKELSEELGRVEFEKQNQDVRKQTLLNNDLEDKVKENKSKK